MELAHGTRLDGDLRHADLLSDGEHACIRYLHRAAAQRDGCNLGKFVRERWGNLASGVLDRGGARRGRLTGENVEFRAWDIVKCRHVRLEVLSEDFLRNVCRPVRQLHTT